MRKNYVPWLVTIAFYSVVVLGANLVLVLMYIAISGLSGGTAIFEAPLYFRTLSNALFLEGALVLTAGAFLEFFARTSSSEVAKIVMRPSAVILRHTVPEEKDGGIARIEDERSGGWMLIFIGASLVVLSAISAIISMK